MCGFIVRKPLGKLRAGMRSLWMRSPARCFFWAAAAGTRAGWMRERFRMPDIRFRPLRRERLVWRDPAGTR